jgi:hypothetical protein
MFSCIPTLLSFHVSFYSFSLSTHTKAHLVYFSFSQYKINFGNADNILPFYTYEFSFSLFLFSQAVNFGNVDKIKYDLFFT